MLECIRALLQHRDTWTGAAAELLELLPDWPGSPVTLHRDPRTLAPRLSAMDVRRIFAIITVSDRGGHNEFVVATKTVYRANSG